MNKVSRKSGFTLVEIMIVVAIIALLAAIAIPNLLRARISSNDALAKSTLRAVSTAAESFATANSGNYPGTVTSMTGASPAFLNTDYCGNTVSGYVYTCTFALDSYTVVATPVAVGTSGSTTYTITTGGVLTP
jgi:type IV pilus assembly protein PilA